MALRTRLAPCQHTISPKPGLFYRYPERRPIETVGTHLCLVQELDWDTDGASELAHLDGMCDAGRGIELGVVAMRYVKDNRRVQLGNRLVVSSLDEQSGGGGWRDGKTVVEMAEVAR